MLATKKLKKTVDHLFNVGLLRSNVLLGAELGYFDHLRLTVGFSVRLKANE